MESKRICVGDLDDGFTQDYFDKKKKEKNQTRRIPETNFTKIKLFYCLYIM